jgi:hypothetical protein
MSHYLTPLNLKQVNNSDPRAHSEESPNDVVKSVNTAVSPPTCCNWCREPEWQANEAEPRVDSVGYTLADLAMECKGSAALLHHWCVSANPKVITTHAYCKA